MRANDTRGYDGGREVGAIGIAGRQCRKCRRIFPPEQVEHFFTRQRATVRENDLHINRSGKARLGPMRLATICNVCLQNQRDALKTSNRYLDKAKKTLSRHAKKYGMAQAEFSRKYGWNIKQMAHDIEHAEKNGCCYCHHLYAGMEHGLWDITLDIYNRDEEPYYTNTRWCCATCNSKKQGMPIRQWHEVCLAFKQQESFLPFMEQQAPIARLPEQLPLFDLEASVA